MGEWMNKAYDQIMEYYSAIKRSDLLVQATR